jgi:hypothetical protein
VLKPIKDRIDITMKTMETFEPTYKEIGQPLPPKKEAVLLKIFDVLRGCTFD